MDTFLIMASISLLFASAEDKRASRRGTEAALETLLRFVQSGRTHFLTRTSKLKPG
jgi:hypothetical protein